MAYFQTENPNLGNFGRDMQWKIMVNLWPLREFYGHFLHSVAIRYIYGYLIYFSRFGKLQQEKSGNPA
jgi:hypothetical protein